MLTAADREAQPRSGSRRSRPPWNPADADFDRALDGSTSTVLGAFEGDALVATAMVGHDGHRGWVYYVAVDPGARGRDLGRQIMGAAEEWLRQRGAVKAQLMVRDEQWSARVDRVATRPRSDRDVAMARGVRLVVTSVDVPLAELRPLSKR